MKPMEAPDNGVRQRERERDFVAQRSGEVIEEGKEEGGGGESDPNSLALAREAKR